MTPLRELRLSHKLTLKKMAFALDSTINKVWRAEIGERKLTAEELASLGRCFGADAMISVVTGKKGLPGGKTDEGCEG